MATKLETAYLAGFFDGEGSVSIHVQPSRASRSHVLWMAVTNTDLPTLVWIKERWGGVLLPLSKHDERWQQCYGLEWSWGRAGALLRELEPYLVTKKKAAQIGIEFAARKRPGRYMVTPEEWEIREDLRLAIKATSLRKKYSPISERLPYPKRTGLCARCDGEFIAHYARKRFCGKKCQLAAYYEEHPEKFGVKKKAAGIVQ